MRGIIIVALTIAGLAAPARAKSDAPAAAVTKLIKAQVDGLVPMSDDEGVPADVYVDDAVFSAVGGGGGAGDLGKVGPAQLADGVIGPGGVVARKVKDVRVTVAADGATAVVAFTAWFKVKYDVSGDLPQLTMRASELAVKTDHGWRVAGGVWSGAQGNPAVNAAAQKGTLGALDPVADADDGDASIRAAFADLIAKGVDATGAARKDLIAIGSGPGELTTAGAVLAKAWKAAWVGHLAVDGHVRASIAPSGTTGWAVANVKLTKTKGKTTYAIPFRILAVFDKDASGAWSLAHAHFAVPVP
jgi:ketosteroid isomerase-like protein